MNQKCKHEFHFIEKVFKGGGITYKWQEGGGFIPCDYKQPSKIYYKFFCIKCGEFKLIEVSKDESKI